MSRHICALGHQWEQSAEDESAGRNALCPICAQAAREARTLADPARTAQSDSVTDTPKTSAGTAPLPSLPGYEIQLELGRGAMGVVYKARHVKLNRLVAVKMIQGGARASAQERSRFHIEVEAVARLQHPHIVQIYEVGEQDGGVPFCSLELVDGGTLSRKLSAGPLPAVEAARMLEIVARAVHHAHERGIVHRDLKPGNILLMADGTPKITDFGLAKRIEGQGVTESGHSVLGTPSYMAPEQADNKQQKIGPAADIYALGATLYEMVTGRPPFRADTALQVVLQVLADDPVPPTRWRPDLPRDLEIICLKCLNKDPGQRYASALALADDLRCFQNGEPIQARAPTAWEKTRRWVKRQREMIAFAVGGLALLMLLAVLLIRERGRDDDPEPGPVADKKEAPLEKTPAEIPVILPMDLALVPHDAIGFSSVKLAELLERDGVRELEKEIEKSKLAHQFKLNLKEIIESFEKDFGFVPQKVARVTTVFLDRVKQAPAGDVPGDVLSDFMAMQPPVTLFSTTVPYSQEKLRAKFAKTAIEKSHRGKKYVVGPSNLGDEKTGDEDCICFFSDNIFVLADSEVKLKHVLDRHAAGPRLGPLQASLVQAMEVPFVTAIHPPARFREKLLVDTDPVLRLLVQTMRPLLEAHTVVLGVDLVLRTSVGDAIKADLSLTFPDDASARAAQKTLTVMKETLRKNLRELQAQDKEFLNTRAMFQSAHDNLELMELYRKVRNEWDYVLQITGVKLQGNRLTAQVSLRIDIAALVVALQQANLNEQILDQFRIIGNALFEYDMKKGHLPPAAILSPEGKPLLSWRVALLPYLGKQDLYDRFKLDEAWDSPHNLPLLKEIPDAYRILRGDVLAKDRTYCQVLVGPGTAFEGPRGLSLTADFPDGGGNTILAVEAANAVPWTKPEDVVYDPKNPVAPALGADARQGFAAVFGDRKTVFCNRELIAAELPAFISRNGRKSAEELRNQFAALAHAFVQYNDKHGRLPAAAITSPAGKPLLSWRVALLPYLFEQKLYDQFKLDEAWDSPHNRKLLDKMPAVYRTSRGDRERTLCQVIVGPGTAFEGPKGLRLKLDFPADGKNTLLAVEASTPVPWTKPEDVVFDPKSPTLPMLGADPGHGFNVIHADGEAIYVNRTDISPEDLRGFMTRTGKEPKKVPEK